MRKPKLSPVLSWNENGSTRRPRRASKANVLQSRADEERPKEIWKDVPTETPPPYFPQNPLSPGDEKTAKKLRLTFYGCVLLVALAVVAGVVGLVFLIRAFVR